MRAQFMRMSIGTVLALSSADSKFRHAPNLRIYVRLVHTQKPPYEVVESQMAPYSTAASTLATIFVGFLQLPGWLLLILAALSV